MSGLEKVYNYSTLIVKKKKNYAAMPALEDAGTEGTPLSNQFLTETS